VTGVPFYVTAFVEGFVHHHIDDTCARSTAEQRTVTGMSLVDVLADLHALDPDAIGLGRQRSRRGGYVERQVRRWYEQYRASSAQDLPDVDRCYRRLLDQLPTEEDTTVVHGDYRLGNCIVAADGSIAAVVDWEISTVGDPLADLAYLLVTWARPGTVVGELDGAATEPTMADGFPSVEELVDRYSVRSGRDLSTIDYYLAFNHWRYACITQGVLHRYLEGARGDTTGVDLDGFATAVVERAALATRALDAHAAV
jgi:aminoglycoside phosphotransferase (APT) family kinase protein